MNSSMRVGASWKCTVPGSAIADMLNDAALRRLTWMVTGLPVASIAAHTVSSSLPVRVESPCG